jgi:hypothetical protein
LIRGYLITSRYAFNRISFCFENGEELSFTVSLVSFIGFVVVLQDFAAGTQVLAQKISLGDISQ